MKYWVIVASKDHLERGAKQGFIQASHGKHDPLKRMAKGDKVVYYSPKLKYDLETKENKYQKFTAIATIRDNEIYQAEISEDFRPFRRNADFEKTNDTSIIPIIEKLEFIQNKDKWGMYFRFGFFEINKNDFETISNQMK